mmetsp:Transcript_52289/g.131422  ORF Transcript_52289/g.131422 Transcript_52289/m.131422 type:complete len:330 (-) Transcript_52289:144-1133(-)
MPMMSRMASGRPLLGPPRTLPGPGRGLSLCMSGESPLRRLRILCLAAMAASGPSWLPSISTSLVEPTRTSHGVVISCDRSSPSSGSRWRFCGSGKGSSMTTSSSLSLLTAAARLPARPLPATDRLPRPCPPNTSRPPNEPLPPAPAPAPIRLGCCCCCCWDGAELGWLSSFINWSQRRGSTVVLGTLSDECWALMRFSRLTSVPSVSIFRNEQIFFKSSNGKLSASNKSGLRALYGPGCPLSSPSGRGLSATPRTDAAAPTVCRAARRRTAGGAGASLSPPSSLSLSSAPFSPLSGVSSASGLPCGGSGLVLSPSMAVRSADGRMGGLV